MTKEEIPRYDIFVTGINPSWSIKKSNDGQICKWSEVKKLLSEKDKELESYRSLLDDASEEVGKLNKEIETYRSLRNKAVKEVIALNKEIERLKADKWISVKDRLPNENENVLAIESGKLRIMALCYIADDDNEMAWLWGQVYDNLDGDAFVDDDYNVTHWTPLPPTIETK